MVKKIVRKSFQQVNERRFDELLKGVAINVRHHFAGNHALGGERHDVAAFKSWLQRVARVLPDLCITVQKINVIGWPHHTLAIARWTSTATLLNGDKYEGAGVHFLTLKWGKLTSIDVYEDTQAVYDSLEKQYQNGITEAKAPQIIS